MNSDPVIPRASVLPLGRRIINLVAGIAVTLAVLLQVAALLLGRERLEYTYRTAAAASASTLAPAVAEALLTGNTHRVSALLENATRSNPDLLYAVAADATGAPVGSSFSTGVPGELEALVRTRSTPDSKPVALNVRTERGSVLHWLQPLEGGRAGYLHLGFAWAPVDAALGQFCWKLACVMVLGLIISAILAWLAYRRLARPIAALTEAAHKLGEGHLSSRVPERPGEWDEAEVLARAFNQMAARLERHVYELLQSRHALTHEKVLVQAILDSMLQSVVVARGSGEIIYSNQAAQNLGGEPRAPSGLAYSMFRSNYPAALRLFEQIATGKVSLGQVHERMGGRNVAIVLSPVQAAGGETMGIVEIATDVTEQFQSWRTLAHAEKLNVVGQLAAGVAHEINSPLDGAISASRIIAQNAGDPLKVKRFAEAQAQGLERIAAIVRRLLTFARLPSHARQGKAAVSRLLEEAQAILRHRFTHANIRMELPTFAAELFVPGDELSLIQVLVNLLNNAMDVTPKGGAIKLDAQVAGGFVTLSVTDQGPGISEEVAAKLFTPFFTTKEVGKGTGLGLAVSRNIVEEHGGSIGFVNLTPPWGACFYVSLPRQEDRTPLDGHKFSAAASGPPVAGRTGS